MIGLEGSLDDHIAALVEVFREVWRVLRSDGIMWLNYGDAFASTPPGNKGKGIEKWQMSGLHGAGFGGSEKYANTLDNSVAQKMNTIGNGMKAKDLMMMPSRVAMALQSDGADYAAVSAIDRAMDVILEAYDGEPVPDKAMVALDALRTEYGEAKGKSWWLRQEIIWHKPNPMPESTTDRPTSSHEKIFLLSKSGNSLFWTHRGEIGVRSKPQPDYIWVHRKTKDEVKEDPGDSKTWMRVNLWSGHDYFYDAVAIRTPRVTTDSARGRKMPDGWDTGEGSHGSVHREGREAGQYEDKQSGHSRRHAGFNERWKGRHEPPRHSQYDTGHQGLDQTPRGSANIRNVWFPDLESIWTFATRPFRDAHFATFPADLVVPCIQAGTSRHGACAVCGAPWSRDTERQPTEYDGSKYGAAADQNKPRPRGTEMSTLGSSHGEGTAAYETKGWQPTCACVQKVESNGVVVMKAPPDIKPAVVLDPFAGSGTVGLVADRLGRDAILIEINDEYARMAEDRIRNDAPLFANVEKG